MITEAPERRTYRPINTRRKEPLTPEDMLRIDHQELLLNAFEKATAGITDSTPNVGLAAAINKAIPRSLLLNEIPLDHLLILSKDKKRNGDNQQSESADVIRKRAEVKIFWNKRINYVITHMPAKSKVKTLGDLKESHRNGYKGVPFAAVTSESIDFLLLSLAEK